MSDDEPNTGGGGPKSGVATQQPRSAKTTGTRSSSGSPKSGLSKQQQRPKRSNKQAKPKK